MRGYASDGKTGMTFIGVISIIVFIISIGVCIRVFSSYDKVNAVVKNKEYISGGRGGVYLLTFSYTCDGVDQCHIIDTYTPDLYRKGGKAVIYISPDRREEKVLTDLIMFPILSLFLFIVSVAYVSGKFPSLHKTSFR